MKEEIILSEHDGMLIARICCDVDHHSAKLMREKIDRRLYEMKPRILVLDFSGVTFMDSSGIAVVINAVRTMARLEGKLMLSGLTAQPMKVFRASGIDKIVEIKEAVS